MTKWLWLTGVPAAIALIFPTSIVLGLFLGILPGLVLSFAPSALLYVLAATGLRQLLPLPAGALGTAAAVLLAVGLGAALALPGWLAGRANFARASELEIIPSAPLVLSGLVRVDYAPAEYDLLDRDGRPRCDALCAAILAAPGVTGVTVVGTRSNGAPLSPVTFRLVRAGPATPPGLAPYKPESLLRDPEERFDPHLVKARISAREARSNAVVAGWALRLAGPDRLVVAPGDPPADWRILIADQPRAGAGRVVVKQVTVTDRAGTVRLRRRRVTAAIIQPPLMLLPDIDGSYKARFALHRGRRQTGARYSDLDRLGELLRHTTLRADAVTATPAQVRAILAAALVDPQRPRAGAALSLVTPWLKTLDWRALTDADLDVIARIIACPAVTDLRALYDGYAKEVSPTLRGALVARLARADTSPEIANKLDTLIAAMPVGTYTTITPAERAFLTDQPQRLVAPALVERLADQGAAAVPMLVSILRADVAVEPWAKRQRSIAAVRRALTRLGPDAAAARPAVEAMFEPDGTGRLTNLWGDAQAWRVALVRMGKPVEELGFPSHSSAEQVAHDRDDIRRMAERAAAGADSD